METKLLAITCIRKERFSERYLVLQKRLIRSRGGGSSSETAVVEIDEEEISRAVFCVLGMTCSACAGSVGKEIKRLPGIHEAVIDALNNRAQILFYPNSVNVETIRETVEDAGFEASLIKNEVNERPRQVFRIRINANPLVASMFSEKQNRVYEEAPYYYCCEPCKLRFCGHNSGEDG